AARGERGEEEEVGEARLQVDLDEARGDRPSPWSLPRDGRPSRKKAPTGSGPSRCGGGAGGAARAHFLASSSSMTVLKTSKGCAPETRRPLMKNAGVPMRAPLFCAACMSASTAALWRWLSRAFLNSSMLMPPTC